MMISHPHLTSTRLPERSIDPPLRSNTAQLLATPHHINSKLCVWLVLKNVGAIDPQMVIWEHHTAGSVYKEEIPYMASRCVYNESVQDVQPLSTKQLNDSIDI